MSELSKEDLEIIQDFIQESRDMLEQLEPTIIELAQSCQDVACWQVKDCNDAGCPRHGAQLDTPCWLHLGYLGNGLQRCSGGSSAQDCLGCEAFRVINGDGDTMNAIFRLFHSMKGTAGFLEMSHISQAAHAAESLLDLIRSGKVRMSGEHVQLLCQTCDFAKEALDYVEAHAEDTGIAESSGAITNKLKDAIEAAKAAAEAIHTESTPPTPFPTQPEFNPFNSPEILERFVQEADELLQSAEQGLLQWASQGQSPEQIAGLFRDIHSFKGNCGFLGFADLERLSHQLETVLEFAKEGVDLSPLQPVDTLLAVVDQLQGGVADISRGESCQLAGLDAQLSKLGVLLDRIEQLDAQGPEALQPAELHASVTETAPAGDTKNATAKQMTVKRQDIRVDLSKLDTLINLIGEMVIAENMLIHNPDLAGLELENFSRASQQMSKVVRELQEVAMTIRMIPVSGLFRRMIRLVHDLSYKSGKKVDLQLAGETTEVDKTVIELITDPLVHLIRNALDHGLEPPAERQAAGKPDKGSLKLSARHEEGEVVITLEDDGRGLNRTKILAKAQQKGLIEGDGAELSDRAVYNLIFKPGFSTAEQVTDVSGRGVGMDVVKQNIEKIKGKIELHSHEGRGTRFMVRIPLTLGIIDGMMVRVGQSKCIVPTLAIREAFRPRNESITVTPDGLELVRVRENFFPVVRLGEIISKTPDSQRLEQGILIILEHQVNAIALFVDEILGQQQTVIKGLSDFIGNVRWVSGCTILGDGEVCMILDVRNLVEATGDLPQAALPQEVTG